MHRLLFFIGIVFTVCRQAHGDCNTVIKDLNIVSERILEYNGCGDLAAAVADPSFPTFPDMDGSDASAKAIEFVKSAAACSGCGNVDESKVTPEVVADLAISILDTGMKEAWKKVSKAEGFGTTYLLAKPDKVKKDSYKTEIAERCDNLVANAQGLQDEYDKLGSKAADYGKKDAKNFIKAANEFLNGDGAPKSGAKNKKAPGSGTSLNCKNPK
ncbi:uncharacterized protein LOC120329578 [Styela clava]